MEPEEFDRLSEGAAAFLGLSLSEESQTAVAGNLQLLRQHMVVLERALKDADA